MSGWCFNFHFVSFPLEYFGTFSLSYSLNMKYAVIENKLTYAILFIASIQTSYYIICEGIYEFGLKKLIKRKKLFDSSIVNFSSDRHNRQNKDCIMNCNMTDYCNYLIEP